MGLHRIPRGDMIPLWEMRMVAHDEQVVPEVKSTQHYSPEDRSWERFGESVDAVVASALKEQENQDAIGRLLEHVRSEDQFFEFAEAIISCWQYRYGVSRDKALMQLWNHLWNPNEDTGTSI